MLIVLPLVQALIGMLIAVLIWAHWHQKQKATKHDLQKIPGPKQRPLIGNLLAVLGCSHLHRVLAQWTTLYGPIFKWNLLGMTMIVVTDPHEVSRLSGRELNLPKASIIYKAINSRAPHNTMIATPDPDEWRYMRRMTNPAFSSDSMRKAYPFIYAKARKGAKVLQRLSRTGLVDVSDLSARLTAEVISTVAFDSDLDALDYEEQEDGSIQMADQPFLTCSKNQQDDIALAFTNPLYALLLAVWPWHPRAKRFKHDLAALHKRDDEVTDIIRERGTQSESNCALWACLGRFTNYKDGTAAHHNLIAANAGLFFGAGYETTAHAITWALFELAADPSIQGRVRKELAGIGLVATPGHPPLRHLDFADLGKLRLLDDVIRESLRLHGTVPLGTIRETNQDMEVMGFRIPKGTTVMLPPHAMHVSPHNFQHPDKFWPERWVSKSIPDFDPKSSAYPDATARGNRNNINGSWNPFSSGPRNCIGQTLALAELRTVLAVLIGNFCFELPEGIQRESFIQENEVWWMTLQVRNGLSLKVTPIAEGSEEEDQLTAAGSHKFFYQDLLRLAREAEEEAHKADKSVRFSGIT